MQNTQHMLCSQYSHFKYSKCSYYNIDDSINIWPFSVTKLYVFICLNLFYVIFLYLVSVISHVRTIYNILDHRTNISINEPLHMPSKFGEEIIWNRQFIAVSIITHTASKKALNLSTSCCYWWTYDLLILITMCWYINNI